MPQIQKVRLVLVIFSILILLPACGAATPVATSELPTVTPTTLLPPTPIPTTTPPPTAAPLSTAYPTAPAVSPEPDPTGSPTNTPRMTQPPAGSTTPPATPLGTEAAAFQLPLACDLVTSAEITALFPNPPTPVSSATIPQAETGSSCQYSDTQMNMSIVILLRSSILGKVSILENKEKLGVPYTASGAEIYQAGGIDEQRQNNAFVGLILKGNIYVEITGTGQSYQYSAADVSTLLTQIAARLP